MSLWKAEELKVIFNGNNIIDNGFDVSHVAIDSRQVVAGSIFFAIKGENQDGHDYINTAIEKGAVAIVAHESYLTKLDSERKQQVSWFFVEDSFTALYELASEARKRSSAKIVAITGSMGKTGVKDALSMITKKVAKTHHTLGNYNNHFGLPLTLASMAADTEIAIFELGMNHEGEISKLVSLLQPHIMAITTVAPAHLGHFNSVKDIAMAKSEIFDSYTGAGVAIIPRDSEFFHILHDKASRNNIKLIESFGYHKDADFKINSVQQHSKGLSIDISYADASYQLNTNNIGIHHGGNVTLAFAIATMLDIKSDVIISALQSYSNINGRGELLEVIKGDNIYHIIDDCYNANKDSMIAALQIFDGLEISSANRVAILGGIKELGKFSDEEHMALKQPILNANLRQLVLVGEEFLPLYQDIKTQLNTCYYASISHMEIMPNWLKCDDWVLCKGSNGSKIWQWLSKFRN